MGHIHKILTADEWGALNADVFPGTGTLSERAMAQNGSCRKSGSTHAFRAAAENSIDLDQYASSQS
jgi:hypothetical protein